MPRQDVPYGGAICRLKERIAEIWDKLGEKLHSVNGVTGDAAGDVKIVSADPAVVITNNAASHEIEIGLDSLELPSAAVTSVNGETGAVALDAGDIPSDNGNVQTDLDALALRVTANGTAISNEVIDRQNADSALQTNINAVSASIPEMSVTPNPYKGVERDAQGRAFAADPESGATDKSLTTANWISQTGDNSPNNLLHKTGVETKSSILNITWGGRFSQGLHIKNTVDDITVNAPDSDRQTSIHFTDQNDADLAILAVNHLTDGTKEFVIYLYRSNGTRQKFVLASVTG